MKKGRSFEQAHLRHFILLFWRLINQFYLHSTSARHAVQAMVETENARSPMVEKICTSLYTRTTPAVTLDWLVTCIICSKSLSATCTILTAVPLCLPWTWLPTITAMTGFSAGQNYISGWAPAPAHPEWLSEAPLPLFLDLGPHRIADFAGATVLVIPQFICIKYSASLMEMYIYNIYIYIIYIDISGGYCRPMFGKWFWIYFIFCTSIAVTHTRLLPSGLPEVVRPCGSSVARLHRGAAPGCLKRFVSKGVFWWPDRRQYFDDLHVFNVFILFHFGIVYRKSWSVFSLVPSFVLCCQSTQKMLRLWSAKIAVFGSPPTTGKKQQATKTYNSGLWAMLHVILKSNYAWVLHGMTIQYNYI